jgi:ribosomal protein S18 acetylase RimI-like enzyme
LLQDHWDKTPPLGTPYDPPYLLELIETQLDPGVATCLYTIDVPANLQNLPGNVEVDTIEPLQLASDLLPIFIAGLPDQGDFPTPDSIEARFLLEWVSAWPVEAWIALVNEKEVGFILQGPDIAPLLRRAKGGRGLFSRLWLSWAARQPFHQGRLYFGGVLPNYRHSGIGKQLLQKALDSAREHGWEQLVAGPVRFDSSTASLLEQAGARRGASFLNYSLEL